MPASRIYTDPVTRAQCVYLRSLDAEHAAFRARIKAIWAAWNEKHEKGHP